jgi:hypothetical protein
MATLPEIFIELVGTGLETLDVPGTSAGKAALLGYLKRRSEDARKILFEEIAAGTAKPTDLYNDDAVAIIAKYLRATEQGCARLNLRLLAKCIAGQLHRDRLVADEFLDHAESLASLSRDEVVLLAELYRVHQTEQPAERRWGVFLFEMKKTWSEDKIRAVAGRATRSGLVVAGSAYGTMVYLPSPMLLDLCKTVDFRDALRREQKAGPPDD